jgi:hypothetical protein
VQEFKIFVFETSFDYLFTSALSKVHAIDDGG